jgi:diguanylate cyclase (GGDEF)-like protein
MKLNSLSLVLILDEKEIYHYKNKPEFDDNLPINVTITDVNGTILFSSIHDCKLNCFQAEKVIFQLAEANDKAIHNSYFDYLTGLPNRRHFEEKLRDTLVKANLKNNRSALLHLDLDGFKSINDTLGHEIGDRLLIKVAKRISSGFETKAFIGRLGGDEFSFIIPNVIDLKSLHLLAGSLVRIFNRPFNVPDIELNISASIGISIFPYAGEDIKTLIKNAEIAMYQAKKNGKNQYQIYTPEMDQNGYRTFLSCISQELTLFR